MTPMARMRATLEADAAYADPALWITRVPDDALLAEAARVEAEGERGRPFWGMPVAVKDNIDVAGLPTTAGCPDYLYMPEADAPAVARLRAAGAIVVGKTNLDQFATGLVGIRSPYGVPRAPFDAGRVPGGSSSGSGVAVAAGIVPMALGTDTAGSGRVPAAFGNVVGVRPTLGGVSSRGMVPACRSLDTISVFARTVDEALGVLRVIGGFDAADPYSRRAPVGWLQRGGAGLGRVAVADDLSACDLVVREVTCRVAESLGAETVEVAAFLQLARLLYEGPWVAERTSALRPMLERELHPVTRVVLESGFERRTVDAFDAFHLQAAVRRRAESLFETYDALLLPTAPAWPTLAELATDPIGPNARLGTYTNFAGLCDLVAIAVPGGFGPGGTPIWVSLIGPAWSEGRLAVWADRVHRAATDRVGATRSALPAAAQSDAAGPDETALFCVGAHMSGLPLNGQVTGLGGRLLRRDRTVANYRLVALGARPGLLAGGTGAIEGEVWALPTGEIGRLLSQVAAPLGFGTVRLESGDCLGFLAEAAYVTEALDITGYGGWRAYASR